VALFVVRIWLPDRPGALGQVASRIGSVGGDLVGIDILERGAGRAIDELVVDLPDASVLDLLTRELHEVDGVDVEDVRPVGLAARDPRQDALDTAIALVESPSVSALLHSLAELASRGFEAEWASVISLESTEPLAVVGRAPEGPWIAAFVAGSQVSFTVAAGEGGPSDIAWSTMDSADLTVVLGRAGRPFRARERHQLTALVRIADARWRELAQR
jgi:ACT domain